MRLNMYQKNYLAKKLQARRTHLLIIEQSQKCFEMERSFVIDLHSENWSNQLFSEVLGITEE